MKTSASFLIFVFALIAVAFAYPGGIPSASSSDDEFDRIGPIIVLSDIPDPLEGGFGDGFLGVRENPLNGFLEGVHSMMNRLRQRIAQSIPNPYEQGGFFGFSNFPEGANSTSTTKVINGHVVTVNETTYSDGDDQQGSIFRVRIVDIKPEVEPETGTGNPQKEDVTVTPDKEDSPVNTDRSVESLESVGENEIPERLVKLDAV